MLCRLDLRAIYVSALGALLLSGCTFPPGTIIREKQVLDNGQLITTDARQRAITSQKPDISTKPGVVVPSNITCVEPQPSVALALANGLGFGLSVFGKGSGALSDSVSEGVFQLDERTIAIQALLNASYQNCLDYSNGAITNTFYAIRASNLDNLLVTMTLASEAAGNLRSSLGSVGTQASADAKASQSFLADAVGDIQKSAKALGDARRNTETARATLASKKAALSDATQARKDAEAAQQQAKTDGKTGADLTPFDDAVTAKKGEETKAQGEVEAAQKAYDAAAREQDDLENAMLNKVDATASSDAATKEVRGAGGVTGRPTDTAVLTLGEMQRRFLERSTASQNITACLVELGLSTGDPKQDQPTFERDLWPDAKSYLNGRMGEGAFAQQEATVFTLFSRSERDSQLAQFCKTNLPAIVANAQSDEQALALQRVANERLETALHLLQTVALLRQQCEAVAGEDATKTAQLRAACHKRLESVEAYVNAEFGSMLSGPVPAPVTIQ